MRYWLIALALTATGGGGIAYYYLSTPQPMTAEEWQEWRREQVEERKAENEVWVKTYPSKLIRRDWIKCETDDDCMALQLTCGVQRINRKFESQFREAYKNVAPYYRCSDGELIDQYKAECIKNECELKLSIK